LGGQSLECSTDQQAGHHVDRGRQPPQAFRGGVAPSDQEPPPPLGELSNHTIHDCAGQGTAGARGELELGGRGLFEGEGQADGNTEAVARPHWQRHPPDAPHKVEPAQRALFLARRARPVAVAVHAFDRRPGFLLGGVVAFDHNGSLRQNPLGSEADEPRPELPARLVEGTAPEDIQAREMLDGGGSREPQLGGDRVALSGQGPATS
jgi:hypothetical protein